MSIEATYARSFVLGGLNFAISTTLESDLATTFSEEIAAAKSGTLSTRTDADTGTLTLGSGHGVTTGARLDIYWENSDGTVGRRYAVLVGTVSGTSVPFDNGAGDDLPTVGTEVTAMVPTEEALVVTGNSVTAIAGASDASATITFVDNSYNVLHVIELEAGTTPSYVWTSADGGTNPLAGDSVTKVLLSHNDSANAQDVYGGLQYD